MATYKDLYDKIDEASYDFYLAMDTELRLEDVDYLLEWFADGRYLEDEEVVEMLNDSGNEEMWDCKLPYQYLFMFYPRASYYYKVI